MSSHEMVGISDLIKNFNMAKWHQFSFFQLHISQNVAKIMPCLISQSCVGLKRIYRMFEFDSEFIRK